LYSRNLTHKSDERGEDMNTEQMISEVRDRLEIADALYRFGAGIDFNQSDLLESAAAIDAVIDFAPAARKAGLDFPL
jgi:hypothetical protein